MQLGELKQVMGENQQLIAERGEKLDNVVEKGQIIADEAQNFLNMARKLNGKPPLKN